MVWRRDGSGKKRKKQKKSHQVNDEYDPGLGLYAGDHVLCDEAITVNLSIWPTDDYTDESRRLELPHGKLIDVLLDKTGKRPLHMGAHVANTPYIDCATEDYAKYEKSHLAGKNTN